MHETVGMSLMALVFLTPVYNPIIAVFIVVVTIALMWACGASKRTITLTLVGLTAFWAVSLAVVIAVLWYALSGYQF